MYNSGDQCLDAIVKLGLSSTELRAQPIEQAMGAQANLVAYPAIRQTATPADRAAARKAEADELRAWRLGASMDKVRAFRKKYENEGVKIQIVKVDAIDTFSDEEIDYMFGLAKAAGATAISCEIPLSHTKRLGKFGEKHKMMIGYHGHADVTSPEAFGRPESWETAMSYSKYNGINLDIGHFIAGNSASPIPFLPVPTSSLRLRSASSSAKTLSRKAGVKRGTPQLGYNGRLCRRRTPRKRPCNRIPGLPGTGTCCFYWSP